MDKDEQKMFLQFLIRELRAYHHELNACRVTLYILRDLVPGVDATLENARRSEDVKRRTDQFFEGFEELIEHLDEDAQHRALRELLEKYKPEGEPN